MAKWQKLTNTSDETSLGSILSGDSVWHPEVIVRGLIDQLQNVALQLLQRIDLPFIIRSLKIRDRKREFANEHVKWGPSELEARGVILSDWVADRWPV